MKTCEYCGEPIEGEALPITPISDSGAAPDVYWHREREACARPRPPRPGESLVRQRVRPL
ncbi:hypothetical protein ACFV5J_25215 [Streptomyces zaomyceticus]|uniref:hypothetical protein n=1 Tax=Streptomyces zaomyceticus TaxID=68286 RepID=UPI0036507162